MMIVAELPIIYIFGFSIFSGEYFKSNHEINANMNANTDIVRTENGITRYCLFSLLWWFSLFSIHLISFARVLFEGKVFFFEHEKHEMFFQQLLNIFLFITFPLFFFFVKAVDGWPENDLAWIFFVHNKMALEPLRYAFWIFFCL